jgi:primosomal replication protein N
MLDDINEIKFGGMVDRKPYTGSSPRGDRYCFFTLHHASNGRKMFIKCKMFGEFEVPDANSRIVVSGRLVNSKEKNTKAGTETWEKAIAVESWKYSSEVLDEAHATAEKVSYHPSISQVTITQSKTAPQMTEEDIPW